MRTFRSAVAVALMAATSVPAGVGIQAEVGTLNLSDLAMRSGRDVIDTRIGIRAAGGGDVPMAFDLLLGFGNMTEVPFHGSTYGEEKLFCFGTVIGVAAKIHGGDKSSLSLLGRYGLTLSQDGDTYVDASYEYRFKYYTMVFHTVYAGLEPCFRLGENMEVFSHFGLSFKINPTSKELIQTGGPGSSTNWEERKDGTSAIGFSGILLGFRYNL